MTDKDSSKFLTAFMPHCAQKIGVYQSEIKALMQCSENIKLRM